MLTPARARICSFFGPLMFASLVLVAPAGSQPLDATDRAGVLRACEEHAYAVVADRDGYVARNPAQQWSTRFDDHGFLVRSDQGEWTWGLALERYGFECTTRAVNGSVRARALGARVTCDRDAHVSEWWTNGRDGLAHGFTIHERPAGADGGPLSLTLAISGTLNARLRPDGLGVRFVSGEGDVVLEYDGLHVFDADGKAVPSRFRLAERDRLVLAVDDGTANYPLTIDPTVQRAYLKASSPDANDEFGYSVAVSGDTIVVGAPFEDSSATGVDGNASDDSATDAGAAYVFVRQGATWSQQAYLKASNAEAFDQFGASVAVSGDTIVVGAVGESSAATGVNGDPTSNAASFSGSAYVFTRTGTTWSQQAYLKASNTETSDAFGWSVSVSGDSVVVGALGEASNAVGVNGNQASNTRPNSGAAYVFTRSGGSWVQEAYLKASNTGSSDFFGGSVSISGDTIAVGAFGEASNAVGVNGNQGNDSMNLAGAAYVFVRGGTGWTQQAYLKASNTQGNDRFGEAVAVSGDRVVVGAPLESSDATGVNGNPFNNNSLYSGAAYLYERSGTNWMLTAYLKASNTDSVDEFGHTVSVSGNTVTVGAKYEQSRSTGVDGDALDDGFTSAGAAYVYDWNGTSWSHTHYLKASNTGVADHFGSSVCVDGDLVVVGAPHEDGGSAGVNGAQLDNSAFHAGAAYVFVRTPAPQGFCSGDGTGTACPCANSGTVGRGCANSLHPGGASLTATGVASVSLDTLVLSGSGTPNGPGLYFQGTTQLGAGSGTTFGDGLRCVGGTIVRLGAVTAASNQSTYPSGIAPPNGVPVSVKGFALPGDVRHYQLWYRDSDVAYCSSATFNLTNAASVTWSP